MSHCYATVETNDCGALHLHGLLWLDGNLALSDLVRGIAGLYLFRKPARGDFIEPKNVLDEDIRDAVFKLERLGDATRAYFEREHRHKNWFQDWDSMPESMPATDTAEEEDGSLWCGSDVSETEL